MQRDLGSLEDFLLENRNRRSPWLRPPTPLSHHLTDSESTTAQMRCTAFSSVRSSGICSAMRLCPGSYGGEKGGGKGDNQTECHTGGGGDPKAPRTRLPSPRNAAFLFHSTSASPAVASLPYSISGLGWNLIPNPISKLWFPSEPCH